MEIKVKDLLRFWDKVNVGNPNECWEWMASRNIEEYGRFRYQGTMVGSHRISWIFANGSIPDGVCVLHRCDNPPCCNPAHLFLGSRADNVFDAMKKGRRADVSGENAGNSKLTEKEVLKIRKEYKDGNISQPALARKYHVTQANIWMVLHRKSWAHI